MATLELVILRLLELLFAFIAVWIFRLGWRTARFRRFRHLPGPARTSLVWGHEWDLFSTPPGALYAAWMRAFGGVAQFDGCFGRRMLSVTDPVAVQYILCETVYDWPKPEGARQWFLQLLGAGVLYTEGEVEHQRQRHALAPALSATTVHGLTPGFFRMSAKVADNWENQIQKAPGDNVVVDVMFWANRLSLDTIGLIGFSYDFESLKGEGLHPVAEALDNLTNSSTGFAAFAMKALVWEFPSILKMKSKKGDAIRKNREDLGNIATKVWNDAISAGDDGAPDTLLGRLIQEYRATDPRERMEEQEIKDQISTLISAGYEPVSCTIAWALWELARSPAAQEALRASIPPRDLDANRLHQHPYLDAVFRETVRLHPPILELHHVAGRDMLLPQQDGSAVQIPRGTIVAIPVSAVQTQEGVWGKDATAFRPERWLAPGFATDPRHELLAFSKGPRKCLGRTFAEMEIKALLATLVRQFTFQPVKEIEAFQSFVIRPRVKGETESTLPLRISLVQSS